MWMVVLATMMLRCLGLGQPPAMPADQPSNSVEAILTALQARSDGLKDIRCSVAFVDDDQVNLSKITKKGEIRFLMAEPHPKFLIHFHETIADDIVGKREWYLFDGQWLYQALERISQVTKQQLAQEGERLDFFDLEKTPFPLPFGQKKDAIYRHFTVEHLPSEAGDPPATDHLMCVPKPNSKLYRKWDRLDLYVHRELHLPTKIVVVKNDGFEVLTAEFPDLTPQSLNSGLTEKMLAKPREWDGYKVVVEELVPGQRTTP